MKRGCTTRTIVDPHKSFEKTKATKEHVIDGWEPEAKLPAAQPVHALDRRNCIPSFGPLGAEILVRKDEEILRKINLISECIRYLAPSD
ncbi:unnamed protein product [Dovyalis caffra]|uniref:Uncharacterized protein n=1 Tax=Dovyalis caffra TaxID=77055 RepID=A0AAV1SCP7_9ROSI|nr:unnamed protein product [Dovyalis caffra]